jgi:hypothetical protein
VLRRWPSQVNQNPRMKMVSQSRRSPRRTEVKGPAGVWMFFYCMIHILFMDLCSNDIVIWAQYIIFMWWGTSSWTYLGLIAFYHGGILHALPRSLMMLIFWHSVLSVWYEVILRSWSFILCSFPVLIVIYYGYSELRYNPLSSTLTAPIPELLKMKQSN